MLIDIRTDSSVPIYKQIVAQLIYAVASEALPPGTQLLGVRKVAEQQRINPNTVTKAYQELEQLGILVGRRGLGMEVTPEGPAICRKERQAILRDRLRAVLQEAATALPADDLRRLIEEEMNHVNGQPHHKEKT